MLFTVYFITMKQELTKEEIYFLARVQKIDVDTLMSIRNILDAKKVRAKLILYEYRERVKDKQFSKKLIIEMLMEKYDVSKSLIEIIIYDKQTNRGKKCVRCDKRISTYIFGRNNGICDRCLKIELKNIEIYEEQIRTGQDDEVTHGGGDSDTVP